jgi:hypothetical protein
MLVLPLRNRCRVPVNDKRGTGFRSGRSAVTKDGAGKVD